MSDDEKMWRVVVETKSQKRWMVDARKDFHSQFGPIPAIKLQEGGKVDIRGKEFFVVPASFTDRLQKMQRGAQVILPKDAATILALTGAGKDTIVVDAGGGSGWLTCFLARYVKHVHCCDINQKHLETIKKNVETLGYKNITIHEHDIYSGLPTKVKPENVDVVTLDVPEPWQCFSWLKEMPGTLVTCYCPCITQSQQVVNVAREYGLYPENTIENVRREWHVDGRAVRPLRDEVGHTGFITLVRVV